MGQALFLNRLSHDEKDIFYPLSDDEVKDAERAGVEVLTKEVKDIDVQKSGLDEYSKIAMKEYNQDEIIFTIHNSKTGNDKKLSSKDLVYKSVLRKGIYEGEDIAYQRRGMKPEYYTTWQQRDSSFVFLKKDMEAIGELAIDKEWFKKHFVDKFVEGETFLFIY